ncbi:CDP-glycerol glycerophosphotransferase family protein [Listeria costaricensis]|uniref:CDP-glycerol glycerophosphotransferase family protein n=1 Tax=Listeria costaricensis TaxID=2026604 RepID=UPI001F08D589|nr:CDP-glycerol glycerophosphotransferase family protein [Listeria costaricensis]
MTNPISLKEASIGLKKDLLKPIVKTEGRNKKIWLFNSGLVFEGNPKWLFIYVNQHRPDIEAYWFCDSIELVKKVRKLGFKAETFTSAAGERLKKQAGVFVVNQVKEHLPVGFNNEVILLNLWHGVGCKTIERKVNFGELKERIFKKYITYNPVYKNNQLFLVTSQLMEKHFKEQVGIDDDKILRGGYPATIYRDKFSTYDHDVLKKKGLPSNTKIALYAPTYRDASLQNFFGNAVPDIEKLIKKLKENNMLLIFKMHNLMKDDYRYQTLKEKYQNDPNLLFWDNQHDIYEIFDKIDLAIVDYSSIFYDLLASGVKNFIRYIFDYENKNNVRDFVFDYKEMTFGKICNSFEALLATLDNYEDTDDVEERDRIYQLFWEYNTGESALEEIVDQTLAFTPTTKQYPILYSFDIFDTLVKRKTLSPVGIFIYVQEKMRTSGLNFSMFFQDNYNFVRRQAESAVRDYYRKSVGFRESNQLEIQLDDIFIKLQEVHDLTDEQVAFLKQTEIQAEIDNIEAMEEPVKYVFELVEQGEDVVLVSDMYLPEEVIKEMLKKADPRLAELPLYLSSKLGDQKSTRKLYLRVFEDLNYNYQAWIHHGDNKHADFNMPRALGINAVYQPKLEFNGYENALVNRLKTYDSYQLANLFARFREKNSSSVDYYAYAFVSAYFVPYVSWAIKHALARGTDTLYFISRDGHYLKLIADAIIETKNYPIKTKYIYGSRKAWRIPSFVHEIDKEFYSAFGNFEGMTNFKSVLTALSMDEATFDQVFPELAYLKGFETIDDITKKRIINTAQYSEVYKKYLLTYAENERKIIKRYLLQEIDFNEKFAFVEYWGRGYTQDCLARLLEDAKGEAVDTIFYYSRSIYPTIDHSIRYNFNSNMSSLIFTESIFANVPYQTVRGYYEENGVIKPTIKSKPNNSELHAALELYLAGLAKDLYSLDLTDENSLEKSLYDFSLVYFKTVPNDPYILTNFASLKDSVSLNQKEIEYAPALTLRDYWPRILGKPLKVKTRNFDMSIARSSKSVRVAHKVNNVILQRVKRQIKRVLRRA